MADPVGRKVLNAAPGFFEERARSLEKLRRALRPLPAPPGMPRRVAVILSASRGGSSLLYRLLSRHPDVYSLGGEETPFCKLWGFQWSGRPGASDAVSSDGAEAARLRGLAGFMLARSGRAWSAPEPFPLEAYAGDCAERIIFQWPEKNLAFEELRDEARRLLERPRGGKGFNAPGFWAELLAALRRAGIVLDGARYDAALNGAAREERRAPPFESVCLEEPPFVVPEPRFPLEKADVEGRLLLLKTSADCYRVDLLRALFPRSRILFIHLSRNPAASINGLIDGWLSGGFHSHPAGLVLPLEIGGYTVPEEPWTRTWWKFDLPPGWERFRKAPLPEVAAFQWNSAHRHVLGAMEKAPTGDLLRLCYEDLIEDERFPAALERLARFLGLERGLLPGHRREIPFIMAVKPPAPGKWRKRLAQIEPLLKRPEVRETAAALGYGESWEKWP